jgi:hypothetical protein
MWLWHAVWANVEYIARKRGTISKCSHCCYIVAAVGSIHAGDLATVLRCCLWVLVSLVSSDYRTYNHVDTRDHRRATCIVQAHRQANDRTRM